MYIRTYVHVCIEPTHFSSPTVLKNSQCYCEVIQNFLPTKVTTSIFFKIFQFSHLNKQTSKQRNKQMDFNYNFTFKQTNRQKNNTHIHIYKDKPVSKEDFRGAVFQSTTEGVEEFPRFHEGRAAKVYQLQVELAVHDDILILLVS